MKLSDREKTILANVELRANASIADLAKRSGVRPTRISYVLKKFSENGIITPTVFVDMTKLGYSDYVLYFSIASKAGSKHAREFVEFLLSSPYVTWVSELSGSYQYGAAIFAKNVNELVTFFDVLSEKFGDLLQQKAIRLTRTFTRFNRKYLDPRAEVQSVSFGFSPAQKTIDDIDEKILLALATGGEASLRRVALKNNLALSTCHRRARSLEENGIIAGHLYFIDATQFGSTLFNVLIGTRGLRASLRKALLAWSANHPNVIHFIECVGEWDFEIGVEVQRPEQSTQIVQELFEQFGDEIVHIEVMMILRNLKYIFYRPSILVSSS